MNYFVVFQNKTYKRESEEGIMWAPKRSKNGREIFHWSNMTKVATGDIIFSILNNRIVSVNVATSYSYDAVMPAEFNEHGWDLDGWKVNMDYNKVESPLRIKDIISELRLYLSTAKSPFKYDGGGNQGYLYELSKEAGIFLMDYITKHNKVPISSKTEIEEINNEIHTIELDAGKGEDGVRVGKFRIGHGKFKNALLKVQNRCQICGLDRLDLLIASHIKPWSVSDEIEKVDYNNGLLLCPNHDKLFDKGFVSFSDDGALLVSNQLTYNHKSLLNIENPLRLPMNEAKRLYIKWHRENIFNGE